MSTAPQHERLGAEAPPMESAGRRRRFGLTAPLSTAAAELSGRWQIPLMVVALGLLGASVWRLRPKPQPPRFDELFARAVALKEATLYTEAAEYIDSLLVDPVRTMAEKSALHQLMAETIFAHEQGNTVHGPTNSRRILEHTDRHAATGGAFNAQTHRMRGLAREWLGQTAAAINEHRESLAKGIEEPWKVKQHILQLRRLINDLSPDELHQELDRFLAADVPVDIRFWAAERKIDQFATDGHHELGEKFLDAHLALFADSARRQEYDFLRTLAWYHVGRDEDAERLLRSLREQVVPGDPLYAQVGWLLGAILQRQGMPEQALALFDEVLAKSVPCPARAACVLGRAECLADIERFAESLAAYDEVIRLASDDPLGSQIDLKAVRESATAWYQALSVGERRDEAMDYLQLAAKLAPPVDVQLQSVYSRRLAQLALELGKSGLLDNGNSDRSPEKTQRAREYLAQAGEEYLRLARLATLEAPLVIDALWQAAESFDLGGDRTRSISALETFVREFPQNPRVPEALLQLGRAYQVSGDRAKAIEYYQRNLIEFPRTPAAISSLIPLADQFLESGAADKAEQTLLRIVTPRPGDNLALITPEAPEYRDALFRLGELYIRAEEYEKAIARHEEALERYADDPRADLATFHLADAYRKSAARIRNDLAEPKNIAFKDSLRAMHQQRLERAHEMFNRVVARYQARPESSLSELDRLCLKLSHLYAADSVFDLSLVPGSESADPFSRSLSMYEKAAWLYQREPIALNAYVQIMNCYLRMGKVSQAWMTLQRAKWALRNITDEALIEYAPDQDRAFWEKYLAWLEKKPTFASVAMANAG